MAKSPATIAILLFVIIMALVLMAGCTGQAVPDKNRSGNLNALNMVTVPVQPVSTQQLDPVSSGAGLDNESQVFSVEKYVFFEHHINVNGTAIDGTCSIGMKIDFPTYSFDEDTGILTVHSLTLLQRVKDSTIMVFGTGTSLTGLAGSGAGTSVFMADSMPSSFPLDKNVTIDSVTADGTVSFHYGNQQISLKPNETRENITRVIEKRGPPDYRFNCTAEFITTDRFFNAGILDKTNIIKG